MKSSNMDCAPETRSTNWKSIEWNKVGRAVKSLQLRIAKAIRKGDFLYIAGRFNPPLESLSRVMGNYQARFLGDEGGAIRLSYPTTINMSLFKTKKGNISMY